MASTLGSAAPRFVSFGSGLSVLASNDKLSADDETLIGFKQQGNVREMADGMEITGHIDRRIHLAIRQRLGEIGSGWVRLMVDHSQPQPLEAGGFTIFGKPLGSGLR